MQPINFSDGAHAANAYIDPTDVEQRKLIGSTTVIKKALPPYLVPWAAKLTAEYAVDNLALLGDGRPSVEEGILIVRVGDECVDGAADRLNALEVQRSRCAADDDVLEGDQAVEVGLFFVGEILQPSEVVGEDRDVDVMKVVGLLH